VERVPAHVWDLECGVGRLNGRDLALDPPQTLMHATLEATMRHELHADANAEKRPALLPHGALERVAHAGNPMESLIAIGEGTDARQNHAVRRGDLIGI